MKHVWWWMACFGLLGCAKGAAIAGDAEMSFEPATATDASDNGEVDAEAEQAPEPEPEQDAEPPPGPQPDAGDETLDGAVGQPDAGMGEPDAGMEVDCGFPENNYCDMPNTLGEVSGDTSPDMNWVEMRATGSRWLRVRVREDHSGSRGVSFAADLTSSAEADYDLRIYRGDGPNDLQCQRYTWDSVEPLGRPENIQASWDYEGVFGNGRDDGHVLVIEVFHVEGPCDEWTLRVRGRP